MSYTNLLYHIVYATKERCPFITKELRPNLHAYLGGATRGLGGIALEVGGAGDHIHLLVKLKPTMAVSDFLRDLKSNSSGWAREQTNGRFAWQSRYGAFSVSESQVGKVRRYIQTQEEHHAKFSFEQEYRALLQANGVEFKPQYLWD